MCLRLWWRTAIGLTCAVCLSAAFADLPDGYNHPDVQWREIETDHFLLVFNDGLESTTRLAGDILEGAHGQLCEELGVQPEEKTTIVVTDYDDVGFNNFARRMEHVIYVSNPVMNQARMDPRGWLTHLLRHEYTHVLNGWALRDAGRAVGPLIEWTGMELQPQWFTEGLAEYVGSGGGQDEVQYVLHAAQEGRLLYGGKLDIPDNRFNVMETALVYRQGYSMCQGLVRLYGSDIFRRLFKLYAKAPQWDIAFKLATGDTVEHFCRV
ncbi:MAG: hypothetical protein HYU66_28890, partial [Armatimonadetes bacterium]|nr:hypothetical protein [Armatimonadota bacterium]